MAATTATITLFNYPRGVDTTQRRLVINGTIAIGASPLTYATGGIQLSFLGIKNADGSSILLDTNSASAPIVVYLQSVAGSGYVYGWNQSANKLQIFTGAAAQSPLTELTNGATVPASVSGDVIEFEAQFLKAI